MFNIDWICDEAGVPYLIDINGRVSGAVAICYEARMDLPWLWYQVGDGLEPYTDMQSPPGVRARWVLGDWIALVEHLAGGQFGGALEPLKLVRGCHHDDFQWRDPLPFFGQGADYSSLFLASRGTVRPMSAGIVR